LTQKSKNGLEDSDGRNFKIPTMIRKGGAGAFTDVNSMDKHGVWKIALFIKTLKQNAVKIKSRIFYESTVLKSGST
jgi:hypothetical protein